MLVFHEKPKFTRFSSVSESGHRSGAYICHRAAGESRGLHRAIPARHRHVTPAQATRGPGTAHQVRQRPHPPIRDPVRHSGHRVAPVLLSQYEREPLPDHVPQDDAVQTVRDDGHERGGNKPGENGEIRLCHSQHHWGLHIKAEALWFDDSW